MVHFVFVSLVEILLSRNTGGINAFKGIQACVETQFTGQLDFTVRGNQSLKWSLFFSSGRLLSGTNDTHSVRRWCRQVAQHCPQLLANTAEQELSQTQYWNQNALAELAQQGKISYEQLALVFEGNIVEILFDATQSSMQLGLELQLIHRPLAEKFLPPETVVVRVDRLCRQAEQVWQSWERFGLSNWSPNWAPVIWDPKELQRQTSLFAYQNLIALVDGDRTIRDIAVKLKQPIAPLAQSIRPYVQKEVMGLVPVNDLSCDRPAPMSRFQPISSPGRLQPVQVQSPSSLVAYIEDSRFDSITMSQILTQANYRFINVREPIQALPVLLEHKPELIFLDLLMPVTNGYEVCAQIRRVSIFKDTPIIIVTSSNGIVDRVRAKLVGSSGFLAKPIDPQKVLSVLRNHLPRSG